MRIESRSLHRSDQERYRHESHNENWKVQGAGYTKAWWWENLTMRIERVFAAWLSSSPRHRNLTMRIESRSLSSKVILWISAVESHNENWKTYTVTVEDIQQLAESHNENWKVLSAVMQTVFSAGRISQWELKVSRDGLWNAPQGHESHNENWKHQRLDRVGADHRNLTMRIESYCLCYSLPHVLKGNLTMRIESETEIGARVKEVGISQWELKVIVASSIMSDIAEESHNENWKLASLAS